MATKIMDLPNREPSSLRAPRAALAELAGRTGLASEYSRRYSETVNAVNGNCYNSNKRFYSDVPGGDTFSEHTAVWAVLSECVTGEEAKNLMRRSFEGDYSRASFSFSYYTFRAIEKTGLYLEYADRLFEGWRKMVDMGCTAWGENPGNPRSECHAWSSAPIYEFSAVFLGIKPVLPGYERFVIKPEIGITGNVSGTVPTPRGDIYAEIKKTANGVSGTVKLPKDSEATLIIGDRTENIPKGTGVYEFEIKI